jgi:Fe2+ or Zn2+ uptake regulation protein
MISWIKSLFSKEPEKKVSTVELVIDAMEVGHFYTSKDIYNLIKDKVTTTAKSPRNSVYKTVNDLAAKGTLVRHPHAGMGYLYTLDTV